MNTDAPDIDADDDVPMLGKFFPQADGTKSAPPQLVAEDPEPEPAVEVKPTPEEPTVTTPADADKAEATLINPPQPKRALPRPPSASEVQAVVDGVAGAKPPKNTSPAFGGPKPPAAAAAPKPPAPAPEPAAPADDDDAEPAPPPAWQRPLTTEELDQLFGTRPLADAAPRVSISGLNDSKGRYTISAQQTSEEAARRHIAALQVNGAIPTNIRGIGNYSTRIRANNELVRMVTDVPDEITVLGVTESAKYGNGMLGAHIVTTIEPTDYYRYTWSNFIGKTFGAEEIELGPDGMPIVTLEGHDAPLVRPNGELYYPRRMRIGGTGAPDMYDTQVLRDAYAARIPTLYYGPPGTGKTALCEAALPGLVTISGTADTETADFVGSYVQLPDGSFLWVDGPLIQAMERGVPLFIDEIALIDSRVLALVYSVMDGRREVHITANPMRGTVVAKDGFYVIGACNPNVPGAVMSDALLSRFSLQIEVTTDYDMLKTLGVDREIIAVAKNLAKIHEHGGIMKAPETRELLAYMKVKRALGQPVALANMVAAALESDRPEYIKALSAKFDGTITALRS